jgi:hypothetical protein
MTFSYPKKGTICPVPPAHADKISRFKFAVSLRVSRRADQPRWLGAQFIDHRFKVCSMRSDWLLQGERRACRRWSDIFPVIGL